MLDLNFKFSNEIGTMQSTSIYTGKMSPSIPRKRKSEVWEKEHLRLVSEAERVSTDVLLIGDSIIFQFRRYPSVWAKQFKDLTCFIQHGDALGSYPTCIMADKIWIVAS